MKTLMKRGLVLLVLLFKVVLQRLQKQFLASSWMWGIVGNPALLGIYIKEQVAHANGVSLKHTTEAFDDCLIAYFQSAMNMYMNE